MSFIDFKNVSKEYGDSFALRDLNFKLEKGDFLTIVGHSGSGKSTMFKLILGELYPTDGSIFKEGVAIDDMDNNELLNHRRKTGTIFQNFRLLQSKTVYENISFAMEALGFDEEQIESDVPYVLDLVDLKEKLWSFPKELSGGEQQRVAIARAIVNQPELLLADEPTGNLDPINSYEVINLIKQINKLGTTVILSTHDKGVVDKMSNRVITLSKGSIIKDDPTGKYVL